MGLLLLTASVSVSFAAGSPWTAVASSGTVDESDVSEVQFTRGVATIKNTAPANAVVTLRYNVIATEDLDDGGVNKVLAARFKDNGNNAQVRLELKKYDFNTGVTTVLLRFDSNSVVPSNVYKTASAGDGCWKESFDFYRYAYYVEATLRRTSTSGYPSLGILKVSDVDVC